MTCVGLALQAIVVWGLFGTCACLKSELLRHAEPRGRSAGALPGVPAISYSGLMHSLPQEERLRKAMPVAWVHVPKTSSTFMNAVIHLPGVCPGLRADLMLCDDWNPSCGCAEFTQAAGGNFSGQSDFVPSACAGFARFCNHGGFSTQYRHSMHGHGFIMMREAQQRIMSGWYNPGDHQGWHLDWGEPEGVREYAEWVQGAAVKMIARDGDHYQGGAPWLHETLLAMQRLREGFAFVGIHEEYALSICLLHKMFGNSCNRKEFGRFHKSLNGSNTTYDTSELMGFRDFHDSVLYESALHIFRENVELYVGSPAECAQCFREAGLQSSEIENVGRLVGKDMTS